MKPNISEFSYGYALTEELVKGVGNKLSGAPVFPSLYEEGKEGGGWDMKLEKGGIPLFVQFKLSHYLKQSNAKERQKGYFKSPYYRMHIRPIHHSKQHELLLDLEQTRREVFYAAPAFHEPRELNQYYLKGNVSNKSIWIKPSDIGKITDKKEHYVAFQLPKTWYFCSKPKPIERNLSFSYFSEDIIRSFEQCREFALNRESLLELTDDLKIIGRKRLDLHNQEQSSNTNSSEEKEPTTRKKQDDDYQKQLKDIEKRFIDRHPIELVSYYSSIYLDSQLFIIQEVDSNKAE